MAVSWASRCISMACLAGARRYGIFFFSGRNRQNRVPNRQTTVSFFFSGRNRQNRAPIRQTTVSFFFPVVMYLFFSGRNENFPPQQKNCQFPANRRLYLFLFPVVIKIFRHYKKQYNSTTCQTDDCIFFFPVVIARTAHPTDRQ